MEKRNGDIEKECLRMIKKLRVRKRENERDRKLEKEEAKV